ncbi:MAG TPA: hypothetical protein VGB14_06115 [Acidimicrobiales bacterium]
MTAEVVTITPEAAAVMLAGNIVNRKLRRQRVLLYAKQMAAGKWRLTGETIVFSPTGQLLQGQHRLHACIEAGVSFPTIVVRGIDPEAMRVMDSGLARTAADVTRDELIQFYVEHASLLDQAHTISGPAYGALRHSRCWRRTRAAMPAASNSGTTRSSPRTGSALRSSPNPSADPGDWIIRGVKGEFYPCKPDIFDATYEAVES